MAESSNSLESIKKWVVDHKLRAVGCLWLSGIGGSIAYNWSRPNMKLSVKIIHARFDSLCFPSSKVADIMSLVASISPFELGLKLNLFSMLHAQALTLAALTGAAMVEYYNQQESGAKAVKYQNQFLVHPHKE
ncbi:hypothetical protein ZIOFF_022458 [Zingiber officinale]|uniref:HIG1 domain-containing protein n=1 Tax=Zingiber officinale TaxID=94328 RepID=A0A8J5LH81_ZINOF|nr:hypothetical protein ZIOFF_022458 [Zingiber officinale]